MNIDLGHFPSLLRSYQVLKVHMNIFWVHNTIFGMLWRCEPHRPSNIHAASMNVHWSLQIRFDWCQFELDWLNLLQCWISTHKWSISLSRCFRQLLAFESKKHCFDFRFIDSLTISNPNSTFIIFSILQRFIPHHIYWTFFL